MTISTVNVGPDLERHRMRWTPAAWKLGGRAAGIVGKLRDLAPYAALELVLPGGSLMAILLWLYRRRKIDPSRQNPRAKSATRICFSAR